VQKNSSILSEEKEVVQRTIRRRAAFSLLLASPVLSVAFSAYGKSKTMNPYDERRLLQQNKKIQEANRAPEDFPNFIREGEIVLLILSYKLWVIDCQILHNLLLLSQFLSDAIYYSLFLIRCYYIFSR
jgi:hypothetical protein